MNALPFDRVCVVGLGKLGLPWACILASKGIEVVGIDTAPQVVEMVNAAAYRGHEPDVAQLLSQHRQRLVATDTFEAVKGTQAAFVVVPTPSDTNHRYSLDCVLPAIDQITRVVTRAGISDYTIVLVSTVMPLACEEFVRPAIERASGRRCGRGIHLAYCPEFVALGRVVHDMLQPDLLLIGAGDRAISCRLADFYTRIVLNSPTVITVSLSSAEVAKLAINSMLSFKIACANLLARLCHELPGASVDEVAHAVGADSRIGPKYLRGGLGFGGPCLPRDVRALASLCRDLGVTPGIPEAVSNFNVSIPDAIVQLISRHSSSGSRIGILGLAYRPQTAIDDESQPCQLVRALCEAGHKIFAHDPLLRVADCAELASLDVHECKEVPTLLAECQTVVIATMAEEYKSIDPSLLDGHTLIDCWRHLSPETLEQCIRSKTKCGFRYVPFGIGDPSHLSPLPSPRGERGCG